MVDTKYPAGGAIGFGWVKSIRWVCRGFIHYRISMGQAFHKAEAEMG